MADDLRQRYAEAAENGTQWRLVPHYGDDSDVPTSLMLVAVEDGIVTGKVADIADLVELEAARDRIRALAEQARPATIAACTCWDCEDEEKPNCGQGRVIAWDLDPTAVLAALYVSAGSDS